MPRMRTSLLLAITILGFGVGCGDDSSDKPADAKVADAPVAIDAPAPLTLDCPTYCTEIAKTCTDANAQYTAAPAMNCAATCAKFAVGTSADTSGDTLGCRLYHIQNITVRNQPAGTHCSHAGPSGGALALTMTGAEDAHCGSACANFCAAEAKICTGANQQYADTAACMTACNGFARTPEYSATTTGGNTLACRIYHLTNAAISPDNATTHCKHTGATPTQACI